MDSDGTVAARGAPCVSVVVSTYERPDALGVVLDSLRDQRFRAFEVVVADDGSGAGTRELVEGRRAGLGVPLQHVWQEDRGYRLAAIRNRAAAAARAPYLVFIDGDCIVRPDFLVRHARLAERGRFVYGSRVRLGPGLTRRVTEGRVAVHDWPAWRWGVERVRGRIDRFAPLLRLPLGGLRRMGGRGWRGAKGCNLAVWRDDLLAVNGVDEGFRGWGFEDNDLALRLLRSGVRSKLGRFAVPVLHLWHEPRPPDPGSRQRFEQRVADGLVRAEAGYGIDRHLLSKTRNECR